MPSPVASELWKGKFKPSGRLWRGKQTKVTSPSGTTSAVAGDTQEGTIRTADRAAKLTVFLTRFVGAVAKHWLLIANAVLGLQAVLPAVAPALMVIGHTREAQLMYTVYSPLCHQLPERSFFLFGPQATYTLQELEHFLGPSVPLRYIGDAAIGYKMTVCQRDVATYTAMFLAGLAFIPLRRRLRPLPLKLFALLCMPMAFDGFGQLLGFWESAPWSRVISGALFGLACIWLAFPYVETAMNDVLGVAEKERVSRGPAA
jgi:uncharacterized membrane protein